MGQGKDKKKRKRRKMTPAEYAERHNTPMIANAFRRVSVSAAANTAASASASVNAAPSNAGAPESLATDVSASANSAFSSSTNSANAAAGTNAATTMDYQNTFGSSNTSATSTAAAEAHEQMDVEDHDLQSGPLNESGDESMSNLNSTIIHGEGFSLQAVGISNPSPVEPSIDDDDGVDFDDDEAEDDKERGRKRIRRKRTDFQWKYMVALQKRLQKEWNQVGEKSNQVGALSSKWLIEFLEIHYYIDVTCLILPELEGVDAALEQMRRTKRSAKPRA